MDDSRYPARVVHHIRTRNTSTRSSWHIGLLSLASLAMTLSRQFGAMRTDRSDQLGGRDLIAHLALNWLQVSEDRFSHKIRNSDQSEGWFARSG
jgi:hypothetical protein